MTVCLLAVFVCCEIFTENCHNADINIIITNQYVINDVWILNEA